MRWCRACLGLLLLTQAPLVASGAGPKRVLILDRVLSLAIDNR